MLKSPAEPGVLQVHALTRLMLCQFILTFENLTVLACFFYLMRRLFSTQSVPASPLGKWIDQLRMTAGHLHPNRYTGIVQKAKSSLEIDEVVASFDKHVGGPPDRIFLCAAAKTALKLQNCSSIIAARLLIKIPPKLVDEISHSVAFLVLNKAAAEGDGSAAQLAFSRLLRPTPRDWTVLLLANCNDRAALRLVLDDMLAKLTSGPDALLLNSALQKAFILKDVDLVEHIWEWSRLNLRHHRQDGKLALPYIQYILAVSRLGHLDKALLAWKEWQQFQSADSAPFSDVLRSAMITSVAYHGDAKTAEELYHSRPATYSVPTPGFQKDQLLVSLVTAYSHAGLPERAVLQLRAAEATGPIDIFVYNAAIDACARAGRFKAAQDIIADMTTKGTFPDEITWMSLLGPCRDDPSNSVSVAEHAFHQIQQSNASDSTKAAAYVVLGDVYCAVGRREDYDALRAQRLKLGLRKQRGAVEVTVGGRVHTFHVGEIPPELVDFTPVIEAKLNEWSRLLSMSGVNTESIMCRHSEKLALAYAVVQGEKDVTLQKNLRICSACHGASIALTSVEGIVIRHQDQSRVHIMRDGVCSCGGRY
jgi:pentatricopeptide repeat protein